MQVPRALSLRCRSDFAHVGRPVARALRANPGPRAVYSTSQNLRNATLAVRHHCHIVMHWRTPQRAWRDAYPRIHSTVRSARPYGHPILLLAVQAHSTIPLRRAVAATVSRQRAIERSIKHCGRTRVKTAHVRSLR